MKTSENKDFAMDRATELAGLIERNTGADGVHRTAIANLALVRSSRVTEPIHALYKPALCVVAQGRKQTQLGERVYVYDAAKYLVFSVDLPLVGQVIEASPERPYLCLQLDIDAAMLSALLLDSDDDGAKPPASPAGDLALSVSPVTPDLLDAVIRLVRMLETPRDIAMLAPLAEREILYRALHGEHGARLRQIATADSRLQQISRAIGWIKAHYADPFSIEAVAKAARMSPSALHQHFKAVTAMSPLQFQKQIRLQEARRLLLAQSFDAATAGHNVGYESPSQFSREYSRLFGAPPARDIARLRAASEGMQAV